MDTALQAPPAVRQRLPALLPPLMAWSLVAVLSLAGFQASRSAEDSNIRAGFRIDAEDRIQRVQDELEQSLELASILHIFWLSSEEVRLDEFQRFTGYLLAENASVLALEWAPRVKPEQAEDFASRARDLLPGYRIKALAAPGRLEPRRGDHEMFPILYVAPLEPNREVLGLDLASEPLRREALYRARDRGAPAVTRPLRLAQLEDDPTGFLYLWPVFDKGVALRTAEDRQRHLQGFVLGVYSLRRIVRRALERTQEIADLGLHLLAAEENPPRVLYSHGLAAPEGAVFRLPGAEELHVLEPLTESTPTWSALVVPGEGYLSRRRTWGSWIILLSGFLVATLLASILALKQNRATALSQANVLLRAQIRDREAAEAALRENQRRLSTLMSNLPGAAYRARPVPERTLEFVSEGFLQLTGYSGQQVLAGEVRFLADLVHEDDRELFRRETASALAERRAYRLEYRIRDASGSLKWIWEQGRPVTGSENRIVALEGFLSDITPAKEAQLEKERMQESLRETQKLESLGILAGGIAHDFNNLLTGVLGNAEVAQEMLGQDEPAREPLQHLEKAARRAQQLTAQLLAYAGRASLEQRPVDLSEHLREMVELLHTAIPKKVALQLDLASDLPAVEADPIQLQQLVMNLVLNAAEACTERGGTVEVTTRLLPAGAVTLPTGEHPEGPQVLLEVRDDGSGMDAATQERMFEPFFTTKFTGRGLGLAAVLGIVRAHGGHLEVDSAPGRGTTFRIYLPASRKPAAREPEATTGDLSGEGRILVVDDEAMVLDVAERILARLGYRVRTSTSAEEALAWYRENWQQVDAAILDMTMPGMGGGEMLAAMREIDPGIRVVIASGYLESDLAYRFQKQRPDAFVQKPFSRRSLAGTLKEVLTQTT